MTDVLEQTPAGGSQPLNEPEGGPHGSGAELERLTQDLAGGAPAAGPEQGQALPPMTPRQMPEEDGELPPELFGPTMLPDEPATTLPPSQEPVAGTPNEQRIQLLSVLAENPAFSEETRRWLRGFRDRLIRQVGA